MRVIDIPPQALMGMSLLNIVRADAIATPSLLLRLVGASA